MIKLYFYLPHILKVMVVNFYGYFLKKRRYADEFYNILDYYLSVDRSETNHVEIDKIVTLTKNSKFYSIKKYSDFCNAQLINKSIIKQNYNRILNNEFLFTIIQTAGTTGEGLKFPVCKEFIYHQWALFWKFRIIHGLNLNSWCAYIYGKQLIGMRKSKPPFWIKDHFTKQLLLSFTHLNEATVQMYLEQIKKNNIRWIHAYPSILISLIDLIQKKKLEKLARSLNLIVITTSSEVLYQYQKDNIESTFGCKVRQLYGLTEGVANMFECEYGNLHVDESFSYVEFIKDNESNYYKIVGTNYYNKAFPLVRYDTGDRAELFDPDFKCPCGRKSRVVKNILGRTQDFLVLKNNLIILPGPTIFQNSSNIKKAQIIQRQKGCADFLIIKNSNYNQKDEKILISSIKNILGNDFVYNIIYTDKLVSSGNGKERYIINKINDCVDKDLIS